MSDKQGGSDNKGGILSLYPVRVRGVGVERDDNGNAVLIYPKNLRGIELYLHKYLGGPVMIRRPLDEIGTIIWDLCDGTHTIGEICDIVEGQYKEKIEPTVPRVLAFMDILLKLGLIRLALEPKHPRKIRIPKNKGV